MSATADSLAAWVAAQADLSDYAVGRVLEVGGSDGEEYFGRLGAAEFVSLPQPSESLSANTPFDLVHCSADLETELHPLSVYAWLRTLVAPGGMLLAGSSVLAEAAHSQYAEYVSAGDPAAARWLPGRLAFRWMVEVSGFDVRNWLDDPPPSGDGQPRAYLLATAVERVPALDLSRQPLGR
ncbi:MAG: hypothetical protein ABW065_00480 [Solirubrobacterales bacterium]